MSWHCRPHMRAELTCLQNVAEGPWLHSVVPEAPAGFRAAGLGRETDSCDPPSTHPDGVAGAQSHRQAKSPREKPQGPLSLGFSLPGCADVPDPREPSRR